ncbi:MAG: pirin family protein [Polyangiales bacterium]
MAEQPLNARKLSRVVRGHPTMDGGAGVRLTRVIGLHELDHLDPFLLLDEFQAESKHDSITGFPSHPHRGFETVTYMLLGSMEQRDQHGQTSVLESGGVQWMTAGRGIVHAELPRRELGQMWGFQLWVNLRASDKMCEPRYQNISKAEVPELELPNASGRVRVIAGAFRGLDGAVRGIAVEPLYLDVALAPHARVEIAILETHNACVYMFEGSARVLADDDSLSNPLRKHDLGVLGSGTSLRILALGQGARCLVLAAHPLGETIERYGPFVMNTREELQTAVRDFRDGPHVRVPLSTEDRRSNQA